MGSSTVEPMDLISAVKMVVMMGVKMAVLMAILMVVSSAATRVELSV